MPRPSIDRRSCQAELRAAGDGQERRITGHAAVFNSLSEEIWGFREVIRPGAFAAALEKSDVRALINHDPNLIIGRTKAGTLRLEEDERGLMVEIDPPDTSAARDLVVSMDRGDIDQMSFSFIAKTDRWYTDEKGLTIREIVEFDELFDVSPVTYPAYEETDVSARTQEALAEYRSRGAGGADGPGPGAGAEDQSEAAARCRLLDLAEREI